MNHTKPLEKLQYFALRPTVTIGCESDQKFWWPKAIFFIAESVPDTDAHYYEMTYVCEGDGNR